MIGIDTNVFIRFALNDNEPQHTAALGLLAAASSQKPIFVNPIVWVEAEWLLRTRYRLSREEIADRLSIAVRAEQFIMPDADACEAALVDYRANKADLADCLLSHLNAAAGCVATRTFDRAASRLPGVQLLEI